MIKVTDIKYIGYCRKSTTEGEERQVLSLDDQMRDLIHTETREHLNVVEKFYGTEKGESQSAYKRGRPIFNYIMNQIETGKANALLVWHPNRIARNAFDGGWVITAMDEGKLHEVKTPTRTYYNNASDKFMLQLEFGMAKKSSDDSSEVVKRGLQSKVRLGWRPGRAPLGYLNTVTNGKGDNYIINDPDRFDVIKRMWQMMLSGTVTPAQLLGIMNKTWKFKTRATKRYISKPLCKANIYRMLANKFYAGYYEYPIGSGEWQKGNHEAMITPEEFDCVQRLIKRKGLPKPKRQDFAFTGLMKCASCGAMITAEVKNKRQKNGNRHQYVYYHCTKRINPKCTEKSIRVENLETQINETIKNLSIPESFTKWAVKYLHEYRKVETTSHEVTLANKQRRLMTCIKEIDSLTLRYTSPANLTGELLGDDEYKRLKSGLLKEKHSLEEDLGLIGKDIERAIERTEKTFNFARHAQYWFNNGDMNTKRAILACIGSNLSVSDQKIRIELKKPFKLIFESTVSKIDDNALVRTDEKLVSSIQSSDLVSSNISLRRR